MNAHSFHFRPSRGGLGRLLAAVLCGALPVRAAENPDVPPPAAERAAAAGLAQLAAQALADRSAWYGLPADATPANLRLAPPWRQYELPPAAVLQADAAVSAPEALFQPMDTWLFPVAGPGDPQALLVVERSAGEWRAAAIGRAGLGRELRRIRAQWPAAAGYHPRLVSSFQARRHLFTVPEADAPNLTPLAVSCDPQAAPADYRKLEAPGPALEKLRPEVRANLAAFSGGGAP